MSYSRRAAEETSRKAGKLSGTAYISFFGVGIFELVLSADPASRGEEAGAIGWFFTLFFFYPVFLPLLVVALSTSVVRQIFGLELKLLFLTIVTVAYWAAFFSGLPLAGSGYEFLGLLFSGVVTLTLCVSHWRYKSR